MQSNITVIYTTFSLFRFQSERASPSGWASLSNNSSAICGFGSHQWVFLLFIVIIVFLWLLKWATVSADMCLNIMCSLFFCDWIWTFYSLSSRSHPGHHSNRRGALSAAAGEFITYNLDWVVLLFVVVWFILMLWFGKRLCRETKRISLLLSCLLLSFLNLICPCVSGWRRDIRIRLSSRRPSPSNCLSRYEWSDCWSGGDLKRKSLEKSRNVIKSRALMKSREKVEIYEDNTLCSV